LPPQNASGCLSKFLGLLARQLGAADYHALPPQNASGCLSKFLGLLARQLGAAD
jgi:hypothetical protein